MYGAPFVPLTGLPSTSQSPHCVQTGTGMGGGACDVMPSKHLGNPGGDVMSCLDGTGAFGRTCRASVGIRSGGRQLQRVKVVFV